jgi:hemerythrin superfamily protein
MAAKTNANSAPVVGNDAVEILENDHRRIKALLSELAEGDEANRAATLDELKALLTIHNASEENLVYPAIRVIGRHPGQSDTLYHQQDEAKVAVWELDMLSEDGRDFEARAKKLQSAVLAHIKKEEEHEFPHLREAAGEEALQELTGALRELRDGLHVDVPPRR